MQVAQPPPTVQSTPDVHRIKRHDAQPRRVQTSPMDGTWPIQNSNSSQETPQYSPYNPEYRRPSNVTFTASTNSTNLTPQTPSGPGIPPSQPATQPDITNLMSPSVPDLSAMMFPTSDPFAYPNQPMTTLENQNYIKQEDGLFSPSIPTTASFPNQSFDAQFGAVQNFVLIPSSQQQPQQPDWALQGMMNGNDDMVGISPSWPPQQSSATRGLAPTQGHYDQIFGEDWGGWMNQGYRQ